MPPKKIILSVTNDLNYDQRMYRICTSLHQAGYDVTLVGFKRKKSTPLIDRPYRQVRIVGVPESGKMLYVIYWIKLFFFLLKNKADALCAIDLDTILPIYYASVFKKTKRVYDAHEIFTELKEVVTRPSVKKIWEWMANKYVPKFQTGYTIGEYYTLFFKEKYKTNYQIVRNATVLSPLPDRNANDIYILYQGAVNEGRCFEQLIPAMQFVDANLIICGMGNFYQKAQDLTIRYNVESKVKFEGYIPPEKLKAYTHNAHIGITLFEAENVLSNYYSMANRFFDYMHSGVPQICNAYPEYIKVNQQFEIAYLVEAITPENIAAGINKLLSDNDYHQRLHENALKARKIYCWQEEEKKLLKIYADLFNNN